MTLVRGLSSSGAIRFPVRATDRSLFLCEPSGESRYVRISVSAVPHTFRSVPSRLALLGFFGQSQRGRISRELLYHDKRRAERDVCSQRVEKELFPPNRPGVWGRGVSVPASPPRVWKLEKGTLRKNEFQDLLELGKKID